MVFPSALSTFTSTQASSVPSVEMFSVLSASSFTIDVSCWLRRNRTVLTITDIEHGNAIEDEISGCRARISDLWAIVLKSDAIRAHNTFDKREAVELVTGPNTDGMGLIHISFRLR